MAVSFFTTEVSDLCLGKPALRYLTTSSTVADALLALKSSEDNCLSVWSCNHSSSSKDCACIGKICMVDIVCFLSKEKNISRVPSALKSPISVLLPKAATELVRHVDPQSSLLEVIDLILDGAQNLVVPIKSNSRKKLQQKSTFGSTLHKGHEFCWLTQEDVVRFLLSSIGLFSPIPSLSVESLGILDTNILSVNYHDPPSPDTISCALIQQTSIAVIDDEGKLIGEISPFTLANCDETVAAAITTLSAGDLMAYIDCSGPPPDSILRVIKARLQERGLHGMLEFVEESTSSSSSSDDDSPPTLPTVRSGRLNRSGSYSARMLRSAEAIVCHPGSSLVAVMIQAIVHRVNYIWVIEDDYSLAGIVTFAEILKVFRGYFEE